MPTGFTLPLSSQFRYITVDDLRNEGIDASMMDDVRAVQMITMCSNWVNWLTKQWFFPIRSIEKVDGRGSAVTHHPLFLPILDLFSVKLGRPDMFLVDLPTMAYAVRPRFVQFLYHRAQFPSMPLFVQLDGVFGWLEDDFSPVRTVLTSAVSVRDLVVNVSSTTGINVGDVVLVGNQPAPLSGALLVKGVEPTILRVEATQFSAPSGDAVVRYGRVPSLIQYAVKLLVKDKLTKIGQRGTDADPDLPPWFDRRLQGESVEGYSYSMAPIPVPYGHGGGSFTTGNPEVDDVLQQFAMPMFYVGVCG